MLKTIDTSFLILRQGDDLVAYYDTKHILDCDHDIISNAWQIFHDFDIIEEKQAIEKLIEFFQQNWTRFFLVRQQPIISCISMEENYKLLYEMVRAKVTYEHFSVLK